MERVGCRSTARGTSAPKWCCRFHQTPQGQGTTPGSKAPDPSWDHGIMKIMEMGDSWKWGFSSSPRPAFTISLIPTFLISSFFENPGFLSPLPSRYRPSPSGHQLLFGHQKHPNSSGTDPYPVFSVRHCNSQELFQPEINQSRKSSQG